MLCTDEKASNPKFILPYHAEARNQFQIVLNLCYVQMKGPNPKYFSPCDEKAMNNYKNILKVIKHQNSPTVAEDWPCH